MKALALLLVATLLPMNVHAQTSKVWSRTSSGNWNTATNWTPVGVPSPGDHVVLSQAVTVTIDQPVNLAGTLQWSAGTLYCQEALVVNSGGAITVSGGGIVDLRGTLRNNGTITLADNTIFRLEDSGARLLNEASGVVISTGSDAFNPWSSGGRIENHGTFRKLEGASLSFSTALTVENYGDFDTRSGVVHLGKTIVHDGARYFGAGTNEINNVFTLAGNMMSSNLWLVSGGSVYGTGTYSGVIEWVDGSLALNGPIQIGETGILNLRGTSPHYLYRHLTNRGTILFHDDARLTFNSSATRLVNMPGATIDSPTDNALRPWSSGGILENRGLIRNRDASTLSVSSGVSVTNSGTMEASSGVIQLGACSAGSGSSFVGAGTNQIDGGFTLDGYVNSSNLWLVSGGTLRGVGGWHGVVHWLGGSLTSTDPLTIPAGSRLVLHGTGDHWLYRHLTNRGTIVCLAGAPFGLNSSAARLINTAEGRVELEDNNVFKPYSGGGMIENHGRLLSLGTGGFSVNSGVSLEQSGTVETSSGNANLGACTAYDGSRFLGAGTNRINAALTLDGFVISSNLHLVSGGSLRGTGGFHGILEWEAGTLAYNGPLTIPTNSTLVLAGTADHWLERHLTNHGTIICQDSAPFGFNHLNSRLINQPGGRIETLNNNLFKPYSGGAVLENHGLLSAPGPVGFNIAGGITLAQYGTVETRVGNSYLGDCLGMNGSRFLGAGTNYINRGMILDGFVVSSNLWMISGGSLQGTGGYHGTLDWEAGSMAGNNGEITVASNSVLNLRGAGDHWVSRILNNLGTIHLLGDARLGVDYSTSFVRNEAGGLIESHGNNRLRRFSDGSFENRGLIRKSGGATLVNESKLYNWGTIDTLVGETHLGQCWGMDGSRFTGTGTNRVNSALKLDGTTISSNLWLHSGGQLSGPAACSGIIQWQAGSIAYNGPLTINPDGLLVLRGAGDHYIYRHLTNAGTIRMLDDADLNLNDSGSRLVNLPDGTIEANSESERFEVWSSGGVLENRGRILKQAGQSLVVAPGFLIDNSGVIHAHSGRIQVAANDYTDSGGRLMARLLGAESNSVIAFDSPRTLPVNRVGADLAPGFAPLIGQTFITHDRIAVTFSSPTETNLPPAYRWRVETEFNDDQVPVRTGFTVLALLQQFVAPTIQGQPADLLLFAGQSGSFSVTADGTPAPNYTWFFDGTSTGGNTNTLRIPTVNYTHAGTYWAVVSNSAGSVTSSPAALIVRELQLSIITSNGMPHFQLPTVPGTTLQVQSTTNLVPAMWHPMGTTINGDGNPAIIPMQLNPEQSQQFFRVILLP